MGLREDLRSKLLIADGAIGTILYSRGIDRCFEELNLTHPEQIEHVHEAYIQAGANIIQTNTYGANYIKLKRYGLQDEVKKINQEAVRIAKRAAKGNVYVLGNIGGIHGGQAIHESEEEIKRSFREQLYCLLLEGVDGLILETYYDLDELKTVLQIAREETDIPIIANVSMHEPGVLENGASLTDALTELEALGADVVGINCRLGPAQMISSLENVPLPKKAVLAAYPNASLPAYKDGVLYYENEPAYFETCAKDLRDVGVHLIGGCCGTTPEHIQAMVKGVEGLAPITEKTIEVIEEEVITPQSKRTGKTIPEKAKERHTIIVELDAPKDLDITAYMEGAKVLKEAGADAITLADNSLATPRIGNIAMATLVKEQVGIEPIVHLTCRDRNLIGLQSHLMALHTLGLTEMLTITGDPTKIGDFPGATSVFDVNSFKLIELIKKGNEGISFSGKSLKHPTEFSVAGAFDPNVANMKRAVQRLERKIASGSDYILTQPIYDADKIREMKEVTSHLEVPIFVGIMPLTSTKNAEFLHHEVPGIRLTDEVRARMKATEGNRAQATAESIAISKELIDVAIEHFHGIYLITPFMRYDITAELTRYIREKTNTSAEHTTASVLQPN